MSIPTEAELQAWVDGRLAPSRRAEVDSYLAVRPDESERLTAYRRQNKELRALFNPVMDESLPSALTRPPRRPLPWMRIAAAISIAVGAGLLGMAAGWSMRGQALATIAAAPDALPHRAAVAHAVYAPEVRHPVEVGADQQKHLVAWLSKRLGTELKPPQLSPLGYELVGGRLLPGDGGPVAQFMYADSTGQRLTLYVSSGQKEMRETGFRFAQEGNVRVFYWIDGSFGYALSGSISKDDLGRIAQTVYDQLTP
ncbi:anti-sigma factor family protein [Pseudoduganella sp. RAF53_2]|jgi:anti-sigma factor RsiW|uniref:anti-sigma factor family protein n=1 Tax=unclassified Pseudoduganella TaxID=2637179 RepID=UPI003F97FA75